MSIDLSTQSIINGVNDILSKTSGSGKISGTELAAQFKDLLAEETSRLESTQASADSSVVRSSSTQDTSLAEMQQLIDSLDKSILGTVASSLDSEAVASDLLESGDSGEVIGQLMSGHLNSIVMTPSDSMDDSEDDLESRTSSLLDDPVAESLAENLETIIAHLGQTSV